MDPKEKRTRSTRTDVRRRDVRASKSGPAVSTDVVGARSAITAVSKSAPTLPELPAAKPDDPGQRRTKPAVPRALTAIAAAGPASAVPTPSPSEARYSVVPARRGAAPALPTLARYLKALPEGLSSYPTVLAKGLIVRTLLLDTTHSLPVGAGLPRELEKLVQRPPSANEWVPAVLLCAIHSAFYDLAFAAEGGAESFEEWTYQRSIHLMQTPVYRRLMTVGRPEELLALHGARWSAFYRGATLDVLDVGPGKVVFRQSYPPFCWPEMSRIAVAAGLRAAVSLAGAKSVTVKSTEDSPRTSRFHVRWQ